jgi:Ca2+-binding RTX toxin-like protein
MSAARRTVLAGAGLSLGATLISGAGAQAADFTVSNLNDSGPGSLRQAVADANAAAGADRVLFQSTLTGQITVGSELGIYGPTEVLGPGPDSLTISGNNSSRIFYIFPTAGQTPVTISGLTLTGGRAVGGGAAIFSKYANLTVANAVISQSSTMSAGSSDSGGGIFTKDGGLTVRSTTISGNSAGEQGGGIYSLHYSPSPGLTIEDSTITGNSAGKGGGGAAFYEFASGTGASLKLRDATVSGNRAGTAGGGIATYAGASRSMVNTIVADNTAFSGPDVVVYGAVGTPFDASFSLVEDPSLANLTGGSNVTGQDPKLLPLADNGGGIPTQALDVGSPAIDQGQATGVDQRGAPRPFDLVGVALAGDNDADIGAYERVLCGKALVNVIGTEGPDKLLGGAGPDGILGLGGDDKIKGRAGKDGLCGGPGKDKLKGGRGNDTLLGQAGRDSLIGGKGKDKLRGGKGRDKEKQ